MEMWCLDDTGRASWDWVGPPTGEHDSTPRSGVEAPRLLKRSLHRLYYCCCWLLLCCCCGAGVLCCTSHTACTDAHTLAAHHIAPIPCTTSVTQSQPDSVPKIVVSFHLSRAMSLLLRTEHPALHPLLFSSVPGLQKLLTSRNLCADPRERGGDGCTDPEPLRRKKRTRR